MVILPTLFVSHGAPTLALEPGKAGEALAYLGRAVPQPKAILVVSAHWGTDQPAVSGAERPQTLYDFHGFPPALYEMQYSAPGAPELAQRTHELLQHAGFKAQIHPKRGLDHGAWVPLRLMYPRADIPVTQLSVQPHKNADYHYLVGQALAPLRQNGVLILASGSLTHNLHEAMHRAAAAPVEPYVKEFQDWIAEQIHQGDLGAITLYRDRAPHAQRAHPTEEHLFPLFVAMGAAHGEKTSLRIDPGTTFGVLAMDAFVFGAADVPVRQSSTK